MRECLEFVKLSLPIDNGLVMYTGYTTLHTLSYSEEIKCSLVRIASRARSELVRIDL
jgi:hypothetical protein